jgi:hypothetical protein
MLDLILLCDPIIVFPLCAVPEESVISLPNVSLQYPCTFVFPSVARVVFTGARLDLHGLVGRLSSHSFPTLSVVLC